MYNNHIDIFTHICDGKYEMKVELLSTMFVYLHKISCIFLSSEHHRWELGAVIFLKDIKKKLF